MVFDTSDTEIVDILAFFVSLLSSLAEFFTAFVLKEMRV